MKFKRPAQDPLEINLLPLIDCLLFLIVFFLLTTTFAKTGKLQVQLPQADGTAAAAKAKPLEVVLAAATPEALRAAIVAAAGGSRDQQFVISADGKAPHQSVVTAMDLAGQLGFRNLGIGTQNASTPTTP